MTIRVPPQLGEDWYMLDIDPQAFGSKIWPKLTWQVKPDLNHHEAFIPLYTKFPVFHYNIINFWIWGTALGPSGIAKYILCIFYMTILKSKKLWILKHNWLQSFC